MVKKPITKDAQKQVAAARKLFAEMLDNEASANDLTIAFLILANEITCDYYDKVKKNGKTIWEAKEPIKSLVKPFEDNLKKNPKRLAFTALMQALQMEKPAKMTPEFNARTFKYAAVVTIAAVKDWDKKVFPKELKKEGGMTRLVKLYSKHVNKDKATPATTTKVVKRNLKYFKDHAPKATVKTTGAIHKEFDKKVVIALMNGNSIKILREFPSQGKLEYSIQAT